MKRYFAMLSFALLVAAGASGQIMISFRTSAGSPHSSATFQPQQFASIAVTGAPYSGEEVNEHVQTLANGTHITRTNMRQKVWRDSQGRLRTERPLITGLPRTSESPTVVQITDPVAGYMYTLDPDKKVVHRVALPAPHNGNAAAASGPACRCETARNGAQPAAQRESQPPRPQFSNEDLGTKSIDGVVVQGHRQVTTYPTGSEGNDAPFSVTTERWWSPDLKIQVLSVGDDPRNGVNTQRIDNLSLQEPDSTLFQLPPDYTVVDETGSFTITWGGTE